VPFYRWAVLGQRDLPFIQGWSLGVEEKFYLIWPFLAFVWWRGRDALRLRGTIALAVGIGLLAGGLSLGNRPLALLGRNFFSYFPILVGCILALLLNDETWFRRFRVLVTRRGTAILGAGFLFVHFATPHVPGILLWNVWGVLYSLATALLLAWVLLGRGHLQTVLERPGLVVLGQHSYGIYLIHGFAISAAYKLVPASLVFPWRGSLTYGIACVLSFGGAVVLARGVERPCIALGRRLSDRLRAGAKVDERTLPGVFAGKVSVNTEDQPLVRLPNDPSLAPASRYGRPRKEMPAR
jgi:peptidoglycan/LPS O-acetylase OafA/YrhL